MIETLTRPKTRGELKQRLEAEERFDALVARVRSQGFVFDSHGCGYDVYAHTTNDDRMRVYRHGALFHDSGQGYKKVALPEWSDKEAE